MTEINHCGIRVGVSACLLGEQVRYDGGHKRADFLFHLIPPDSTAQFVWVSVCPEVELGLGVPRAKIHRVLDSGRVSLRVIDTEEDLTSRMQAYGTTRITQLSTQQLSGYIFKQNSPSCGLRLVNVFDPTDGAYRRAGAGVFAAMWVEHFPEMPVAEESDLQDPAARNVFLRRVREYHKKTSGV